MTEKADEMVNDALDELLAYIKEQCQRYKVDDDFLDNTLAYYQGCYWEKAQRGSGGFTMTTFKALLGRDLQDDKILVEENIRQYAAILQDLPSIKDLESELYHYEKDGTEDSHLLQEDPKFDDNDCESDDYLP